VNKGEHLNLVGRNEDETWFAIKAIGSEQEWVSKESIQVNIDALQLPIVDAPPTPIPPLGKVTVTNYLSREVMVQLGTTYFMQNRQTITVELTQDMHTYRVCLYKIVGVNFEYNCGSYFYLEVGPSTSLNLNSFGQLGISP